MSRYLTLARAALDADGDQPVSDELNEKDEITLVPIPDVLEAATTSSIQVPLIVSGQAATGCSYDLGRAMARTSSTVTSAHLRQDVRDCINQGIDPAFWEAVLKAAGEGRRSAAGRCDQCGEPRLWWTPGAICPVCEKWERPDSVHGVSLALLLDLPIPPITLAAAVPPLQESVCRRLTN